MDLKYLILVVSVIFTKSVFTNHDVNEIMLETGDTAYLAGMYTNSCDLIEWEFMTGNNPEFILQYYTEGSQLTIYGQYRNRVKYMPKINMLILTNVSMLDSGTYVCRVDLKQELTVRYNMSILDKSPISDCECSYIVFYLINGIGVIFVVSISILIMVRCNKRSNWL